MNKISTIPDIRKRLDTPLILIGMPASGKTVLGSRLADMLGIGFIDLDHLIVEREGRLISQIFDNDGEAAFRDIEEQALSGLMKTGLIGQEGTPYIISTGGGAVLRPANRALIFGQGHAIWVRASIPVLLERVAGDTHARPLLKNKDPEQALRSLEAERNGLYSNAHIKVDTDHRSPEEILPEIITKIHERLWS